MDRHHALYICWQCISARPVTYCCTESGNCGTVVLGKLVCAVAVHVLSYIKVIRIYDQLC